MERKKNNAEQEAPPKIEQEEVPQLSPQEIEQHDRVDRDYFDTMPPGYRFVPTGEELIVSYLNNKLSDMKSLPLNRIRDVNIYDYHPQKLTSVYKLHRGREWYFFTPRFKKYLNGQVPNRAAGNGFWKAYGADVPVCHDEGIKIGTKKTLIYYEGKAKENNVIKTDWIMHEYISQVDSTSNVGPVDKKDAKDMKLDEWVLCKIFNQSYKSEEEANNKQLGNNPMIVPANRNQLPNQNPNGDTFPRQNVQLEPNPTTNQGRKGASVYNRTRLFVPNQNIKQGQAGGSFYNRVSMPTQNAQVSNHHITQGPDGTRFYNMASNLPKQNVQVLNPNITQGRDGTPFYNMASNLPTQTVQVPNPNITHGLDVVSFYSRPSLPMHNVHVSNSNTNQFPYGEGIFDNMASLPIQNDGLDAANNFNTRVSFPPSYDQTQNRYGRNRPYFQSLGNNLVNNQQVVSPDPPQIVQAQAQYQHQIFPPHQDMGMGSGITNLFGNEPYGVGFFENMASLPIQNDGLEVANNFYTRVSFPPSYDQTQNRYGRNWPYFQTLGNNLVNNQQVISPDPLQIVQAQYQHQIFPPHQDTGMDSGIIDLCGDDPYDAPSQEALQSEEQTESLNCPPHYPALDSKDAEVGGPDQAALSSKEKKKGG